MHTCRMATAIILRRSLLDKIRAERAIVLFCIRLRKAVIYLPLLNHTNCHSTHPISSDCGVYSSLKFGTSMRPVFMETVAM